MRIVVVVFMMPVSKEAFDNYGARQDIVFLDYWEAVKVA
jgi:hypothetical protein